MFAVTPSDHERYHASLSHAPPGDCVRLCRDHRGKSSNILYSLGFGRMSVSAWVGSQEPNRRQTKGVGNQPPDSTSERHFTEFSR